MAYQKNDQKPLVKIGALWKGRQGSKAVLTGALRIKDETGKEIRVFVMDNREFKRKDSDPDFVLKAAGPVPGFDLPPGRPGAAAPPAAKSDDLSEFGL